MGDYASWAFIDVNGNASGDEDALPDAGDYYERGGLFDFYPQELVSERTGRLEKLEWQVYQ